MTNKNIEIGTPAEAFTICLLAEYQTRDRGARARACARNDATVDQCSSVFNQLFYLILLSAILDFIYIYLLVVDRVLNNTQYAIKHS